MDRKPFFVAMTLIIVFFVLGAALQGTSTPTIRAQALQAAVTGCAGRFGSCDPFKRVDEFERYILTGKK